MKEYILDKINLEKLIEDGDFPEFGKNILLIIENSATQKFVVVGFLSHINGQGYNFKVLEGNELMPGLYTDKTYPKVIAWKPIS